MSPLAARVRALACRRLLVVGDFVADHYIYGQTDRVSREAPVLVVRYEQAEVKLGGGANVAANAASLGGRVTAVGVLGQDEMGRALRASFRAAGIQVSAPGTPGLATETKTRILAGGVNTTRQQMLRLDRAAVGPLPQRARTALASAIRRASAGVEAVVVSDYGAGVLCEETRAVLAELAASGMPVCVDSRYALDSFRGFTLCKPNEPELSALTGVAIRDDASLARALRAAAKVLRCKALVATRGRNGMAVWDGRSMELLPVHGAEEAVDVTGAGDTVISALALGLAAGASVLEAAQLANVAGGLVVMKPGTATVSHAELLAGVTA
ncbi:MAG: bifunctional hydroxymethylpyrimidine kinase/phosphomethylpyrimidine kinase [Deltaproteobacteria bacterium]|nr:bifunctional hydroxymethylpyrimidine kinase/phosphomethylpyrimidine kinase [Deltaproteobacteria bacterium]